MDSIKKLTDLFAKFPTIGSRTASRFVFYLLKLSPEKIDELTQAIHELKNKVKLCKSCFQPSEAPTKEGLCRICSDPSRNRQLLCVVEKETDLIPIENTKKYNGLYFVLGGVVLKKNNFNSLRIEELKEKIKNLSKLTEIIIAINPTPEGRATSVLIERTLRELQNPASQSFKITYLAKGLPVGGELEYADQETLEAAFDGRK